MPSNDYKGLSSSELPGVEETLSTSTSLVDHLLEQQRMAEHLEQQQRQVDELMKQKRLQQEQAIEKVN